MNRKFALALAATAAIAAAALTPTAASAHWNHHHHRWHGHGLDIGLYVPTPYVDASYCYTSKTVVDTWNGPRVRRVTYCN